MGGPKTLPVIDTVILGVEFVLYYSYIEAKTANSTLQIAQTESQIGGPKTLPMTDKVISQPTLWAILGGRGCATVKLYRGQDRKNHASDSTKQIRRWGDPRPSLPLIRTPPFHKPHFCLLIGLHRQPKSHCDRRRYCPDLSPAVALA